MELPWTMIIAVLVGLVFSVVVHECAHGLVALWLGDETARRMGRLTLNPIPHIDPVMSILVPLFMQLTCGVAFGGARPVPINPVCFRINPYVGMMLVAAAGPISNFLLAACFCLSLNLLPWLAQWNLEFTLTLKEFLRQMIVLNLVLALFNLIPIPPLDGSKIVAVLFPRSVAHWIYSYQAQVAGILFIALLVSIGGTAVLNPIIATVGDALLRITYFNR